MECCRLRYKDVDFDRRQIFVSKGKGAKDRYVQLAVRLIDALKKQLQLRWLLRSRELQSLLRVIHCVTASPHTSWMREKTFEQSKSCLVMPT